MTTALLLAILGLALLDSLNPATIVAVILILLAAPKRPGPTALAAVVGAALTVFTLGALLFLTAGAAAAVTDGILTALRFVAFGAAAIALIVAGIRRFRDRPRRAIALPDWFRPSTAIGFGALITAADLPNAFPYFIAIERMVDAGVSTGWGLLIIAGYTVVYCLPCLLLLVIGVATRERTVARLERLTERLGSGVVRRSVPIGITWIVLGVGVGSVPFWI